jgi:hypothetical protein
MTEPYILPYIDDALPGINERYTISSEVSTTANSIPSSPISDISKSSRSKKSSKAERSNIWKEFTKEQGENGDIIRIKCNHCKTSYKSISGSTTNLWAHFEKFHKITQAGEIDIFLNVPKV